MKKCILKKIFFTFLVCSLSICAKAQIGYDYAQYDFGVAAGINQVYGDAETVKQTPSVHLNFTYNQSPYINYVFEVQLGRMGGGDSLKTMSGRQFTSTFSAYLFRAQVQAGEFIDYSQSDLANALKNLYVGTGIGIVYDQITDINRASSKVSGFYTPGVNNANEVFLPVRIGYEFKIFNTFNQPSVKIDLGYQYNFVFGDDLDGFKTGAKNDAYSQLTIGVKFAIGGITSYRKQIYR